MDLRDDDIIVKWVGGTPPIHPALLARPEVRAALAEHDLRVLFQVLGANGWTQRQIDAAAGIRQSEVSKILRGRRVREYRGPIRHRRTRSGPNGPSPCRYPRLTAAPRWNANKIIHQTVTLRPRCSEGRKRVYRRWIRDGSTRS